jgi:3-deoxy-D-manno-octulosonic-acid transferase
VRKKLSLTLYSALMSLVQPFLRQKIRRRAKAEPLYGQFIEERFGQYTNAAHEDWIWIHAVSLGETRTAGILLKTLRQTYPGMKLLLSNGTATGREEGQKLLQPGDVQVWQPWDSAKAVHLFFKAFKPKVGLIMETEVWPNLVHVAAQMNVPLVLVNARMSEKSMNQAMRWPSLMCPAFNGLSAVLAQTQSDADRLTHLSARVKGVYGNLKFDAKPDESQMLLAQHWRTLMQRPVLMLASSREGEEALWLQAWQNYCQKNPLVQVNWLIVPRHPQRVAEVEALIQSQAGQVSRRSSWGPHGPSNASQTDAAQGGLIFLGDSLGEMALYYSFANVALLGGSFEKLGGQNLIEAAACGCPVVMGPHTFNFADASQAAENSGAALRVANMEAAVEAACKLILSPEQQLDRANKAKQFALSHGGATQRTAMAVQECLSAFKGSATH